jgi:hypothetical protein
MSAVIENVVLEQGVVEPVGGTGKKRAVKLPVKYERVYMTLYTVLESFCIPSENMGDFVLKPEEMRKILDAVEFYSDNVAVQSAFIEENLFSKENIKQTRKKMKAERLSWKIDNGLIQKKKRASRPSRAKKNVSNSVVVVPVVESVVESVVVPVVESVVESVVVPDVESVVESVVVPDVESVVESVVESDKKNTKIVKSKKNHSDADDSKPLKKNPKKPKKKTEIALDIPL